MSGRSRANGSLPTMSRAHHTAWPRPSGSCWRVKLVSPAAGSSASRRSSSRLLPRFCSVASSSNCLSKWSSMTPLFRPVTKIRCSIPASRASSTTCWITGRSTTVSISFGTALVAGRNRVPRPATGKTALRMGFMGSRGLKTLRRGFGIKISENPIGAQWPARDVKDAGPGSGRRITETDEMPVGSVALRLFCASALLAASFGPAAAQFDLRSLFAPNSSGGNAQPQAATPYPEWSGEAGASGHPLMTREAILAAAANFSQCIAGLWPDAARRGISRETFEQQTAGLTPDLRIMDLLDSQPEFTKTFWEYLDILVSPERIARGRELLTQHGATFDAVEKAYGVDRYVVTAIWGIESKYGTMGGDRSVVRSTATLACVGRRQNYFRDEFLTALEIIGRGDVRPEDMKGSWAGAFGPTQFMPTAFKRYAVDFDGDGRRNVVGSVPDVIASTANNLKKDGWASGQSWGYEVVVPEGFDYMLADRSRQYTIAQWEKLGLRRPGGKAFPHPGDKAYLLVPAGVRGPGFLMLNNFRVIMKYNPAEAYALAIGHLADRLRGGEAFVQNWPREERALTRSERLELQQRLAGQGFNVGDPDGILGSRTRIAIREFQSRSGLVPDGFASSQVLDRLRGQ